MHNADTGSDTGQGQPAEPGQVLVKVNLRAGSGTGQGHHNEKACRVMADNFL
jgi:hypothetical protein